VKKGIQAYFYADYQKNPKQKKKRRHLPEFEYELQEQRRGVHVFFIIIIYYFVL
jgi:hypothetical protein